MGAAGRSSGDAGYMGHNATDRHRSRPPQMQDDAAPVSSHLCFA
jgi:hypothetical protein